MFLKWFLAAFIIPLAMAQTTVRMRVGDPYYVTGVTVQTPIRLTVTKLDGSAHDIAENDLLFCWGMNGHQTVNSNLTHGVLVHRKAVNVAASTIDLQDETSTNIAPTANAVLVDINTAKVGNQYAYCGKFQTLTLRTTRPYLIPPTGTAWRTNFDDPDGAGAQQAPAVTTNSALWSGFNSFLAGYTTAGCDGTTAGTCTNEETKINSATTDASLGHTPEGSSALDAAARWYVSQQDTQYLNATKYYLQEMHRYPASARGFTVDDIGINGGGGSIVDYVYIWAHQLSKAYDIVRSQLSAGEKTAFANKMLNGFEAGGCTNPANNTSGAIKYRTGDTVVTGSGFSGYAAKDIIYLAPAPVAKINDGTLLQIACASNTCTVDFDRNHGMGGVGRYIKITGEAALNANYPVASVPSNTSLTFTKTIADATYTTAGMEITPFRYLTQTNGIYVKVSSVQSDTQMTLTQPTTGDSINRPHAKANGFAAGACGYTVVNSHSDDASPPPWNRRATFTLQSSVSATDTVFQFTTGTWPNVPPGTGWIARAPIDCTTGTACEYFLATARNDGTREITFTRGYLGYAPLAWNANQVFVLARAGQASSSFLSTNNGVFWTGDFRSNRQLCHNMAAFVTGLTTAQDDARGVALTETEWMFLRDTVIPYIRNYWTGLTAAGTSSNYHPGRVMSCYSDIVSAYENAFTTNPENLRGPTAFMGYWPLYFSLPWRWDAFSAYDDITVNTIWEQNDTYWLAMQQFLQAGSTVLPFINYWFHQLTPFASGWNSQPGMRVAPQMMIYKNFQNDVQTDFRSGGSALPTYRFFTTSDTGGTAKQYGAMVSKTSWDSATNPTGVYLVAIDDPNDHNGFRSGPGALRIASKVSLLDGDAQGGGASTDAQLQPTLIRSLSTDGGLKSATGYPEIGGDNSWDLQYGGATARYARINTQGAWNSAPTRSMVHVVHVFDVATQNNIVVRYDDFVTSGSALRVVQMPYYKFHQPSSGNHAVQNPAVSFSLSGADIVHRSNQYGVSLLSKVLLPTNTALITNTSTTWSNKVRITETTTASEALVVHYVVQDTVSTMPTTSKITSDSNWNVAEFQHASTPFVVAISKNGITYTSTTFTSAHSGTARYVVAGLTAGLYTVNRGGSDILTNQNVVAGQSVLEFTSTSGAFTISQTGAPQPVQITTTTMPGGTVGVSYGTQNISVTGGTSPYTCAPAPGSSAMCGGLTLNSACTITGTPTTAETCTPTVRASDSATPTPGTDDQQYTIVISPASVPLSIDPGSTTFPTGFYGTAFSHTFVAAGGTPGYTFSIASGTLPTGLTRTTDTISGTPTEIGDFPVRVCVDDTVPTQVCVDVVYRMRTNLQEVTMGGRTHTTGILLTIFKTGLNANATGVLKVRDPDGVVVQTYTIPGGAPGRTQIVTDLQSGTAYLAELLVSGFTASLAFSTNAATIPNQTVRFSRKCPAPFPGGTVDNVYIEYGTTPALGTALAVPCANSGTINISGFAQDELWYLRHSWRNSSNVVLGSPSPIQPFIP